jgi:hypothetical protein
VYVTGNTYPIKDQLRSAGCHWDGERRQWWIGKAKAAAVQTIISGLSATSPQAADVPAEKQAEDPSKINVLGKARYKGRVYYIRYLGDTKRGYAARLITLDGKIDFWATAAHTWERQHDGSGDVAVVVKMYEPREYHGRMQYQTLAGMQRFVRDAQQAKTGDCPRCKQMMAAGKWAPYQGSGDYDDCPLCGATVRITY